MGRHKNNVIETWANGDFYEEKSGRGENKTKTSKTRPYSDCYGENRTVNNGNSDLSFNFERSSTSPVNYNTMTLPRREKRHPEVEHSLCLEYPVFIEAPGCNISTYVICDKYFQTLWSSSGPELCSCQLIV